MWWIAALGVSAIVFYFLRETKKSGGIFLPYGECMQRTPLPLFMRILSLILYGASFFFITLSLLHFTIGSGPLTKPFFKTNKQFIPLDESKLIFFAIDSSGSMAEPMPGDESVSKMHIVQQALLKCVNDLDRSNDGTDLISMITFARAARIDVPFSRDRSFLLSAISSLKPITVSELNGTAIGYAIFKGVSLIEACKAFAMQENIKNPFISKSIILITDGLEEPNPADRNQPFRSMRLLPALEQARQSGVRIYFVNVDKNSYRMLSLNERGKIEKAVDETGGKYFEVTSGYSLDQVLGEVVQKEEGKKIDSVVVDNQMSVGLWLIIFAIMSTVLSRLIETVVMRVIR
jgi:Mg-chelatase subunit ChlD